MYRVTPTIPLQNVRSIALTYLFLAISIQPANSCLSSGVELLYRSQPVAEVCHPANVLLNSDGSERFQWRIQLVKPNAVSNNNRWLHNANQSTIESCCGVHSQWLCAHLCSRLRWLHGPQKSVNWVWITVPREGSKIIWDRWDFVMSQPK